MSENCPKFAQGQAIPANEIDLEHDAVGLTYPNLHRRIDDESTPLEPHELEPDKYKISVAGVNSFRTTKHTVYSEEDDLNEIP